MQDIAPSDEDLIAYALDGEALSQEAQAHLDQCDICQQRLKRYQHTHNALVSQLYRVLCPDAADLNYYSAGGLSEERRQTIAAHLLDCPLCQRDVEEARAYLREQPVELFAPFSESVLSSPRALARRIYATLVARPQMQFVLRSDAQPSAWPRQYKADAVDLSLHLSRTSGGEHMLIGILTSSDPFEDVEALEGIEAELFVAPLPAMANGHTPTTTPLLRTRVDDLGNVVFKPVPTGNYVMILRLPGREVVIEGLSIEET
ncbi:MAG TPA: hypothetical protein VGT44_11360 [Ktedonobacteraceae bacterium]|nr:hypothetical protein [Ktedonobacteraceae bacterium]